MVNDANTNLCVQNTNLCVQNTNLYLQNTNLCVKNTNLCVENANLRVENEILNSGGNSRKKVYLLKFSDCNNLKLLSLKALC
jgi:hypothetical protein